MSSLAKRFIRDGSVYSLQPFIAKAISVFLVPLYTAYLTTDQYGEFSFIFALGTFLIPLIDLGQVSSFWKFNSETNGEAQESVLSTAMLMRLFSGFALAVLLMILAGISREVTLIFPAYIISYSLYQAFLLMQCRMRAEHKAKAYLLSAVTYSLILVCLNLLFVAQLRMNSSGVVLSTMLAFGLFGIAAFLNTWRSNRLRFDRTLAVKMLRYGAPLAIGNIAGVLLGVTDKFMIKGFLGDSALGLYSFGFKFGMMYQGFVVTTFFLAWNPVRWEIYNRPDGSAIFEKISKLMYFLFPGLALLAAGALMVAADLLTQDPSYNSGIVILPVVSLGYCFFGLYYFDSMGLLFSGKTKLITWIVVTGSLANIALNYFLISGFGILGAATATSLSYLLMRILGHLLSSKYYPVRTSSQARIIPLIIAMSLVILAVILFRDDSIHQSVIVLLAGGVAQLLIGWYANKSELSLLTNIIFRKGSRKDVS